MELFGRDAERALIDTAIADARAGRGRLLAFTGEPGIGKSALLREVRARAGDVAVLAGAAWEAGGAPPYWPWLEVLRDARDPRCTELANAIATGAPLPAGVEPAAARFGLLDDVARALAAVAATRPLAILLDDLHAADVPTLDLLVVLARELARSPIAIVAAWREGEVATRADVAHRLGRATRHGTVSPLHRLASGDVARWAAHAGTDPAKLAASEGNPLFVEELLRRRGTGVPAGIADVIREHLALVGAEVADTIAVASVLGRAFDRATLRSLVGRDIDLREAVAAGLLVERDGGWAFHHVLVRDVLYASLPADRRAALHRAAGERDRDPTRAAHHLLAGVDAEHVAEAIATARDAAARAMRVYAFDEAAALLAAADATGHADLDLLLELTRARHACGQLAAAHETAVRAAALARTAGDANGLANAALAYAVEMTSGKRDPTMIALLEEALAGLPDDTSLRIRVMARLATAMTPSADSARAIALAHEAIAAARRLGDDETLLYALRYRLHTEGFLISAAEHLAPSEEVVALAAKVGRPLDALDLWVWRAGALLSLGDRAGSDRALDVATALLTPLTQPHYRWRLPILRSQSAMLRGDFDEAQREIAIAQLLADEHELHRARMACNFARMSVAAASRRRADAELALAGTSEVTRMVGPYASSAWAWMLALAGRIDEARANLSPVNIVPAIFLTNITADAALAVGDRELCALVLDALGPMAERYALGTGPNGSIFVCPVRIVIGELKLFLGAGDPRPDLEAGLALARTIDARPFIARGEAALARLGGTGPLEVTRDGELVRVRWGGREHALPHAKGFDYLIALVAAPNQELHVSDLAGDDDRGDAGEVLDDKARAAYKARAKDLQLELDDARARNDLGRIERVQEELEAITDQLVAATGLGGRARKAGSRVERARVNVQRRLRDAIRRLGERDDALARHLDAAIKTGTHCSYSP